MRESHSLFCTVGRMGMVAPSVAALSLVAEAVGELSLQPVGVGDDHQHGTDARRHGDREGVGEDVVDHRRLATEGDSGSRGELVAVDGHLVAALRVT